MSSLPVILQAMLLTLTVLAAGWDIRYRRVPNWLTVPAAATGVVLNSFLYEVPGFWMSLEGIGLALLIYFPLFLLRGMGAGDAKLMAAVGAIAGPMNWLGILVLTSFCGACFALVIVAARGRLRKTFENLSLILLSLRFGRAPYRDNPQLDVRSSEGVRLPHAFAIACGCAGFLLAASIWAPK